MSLNGTRTAICLALALGAAAPIASAAETFPTRSVRVILPFSPGGAADVLLRMTAQALSEKWGQTVIVDNRPGGNTVVGTAAAIQSQPDGYTLYYTGDQTITINPLLYSAPYSVDKDLVPITLVALNPMLLAINKDLPVKNVEEFVALAKAKPKTIMFGSSGPSSIQRLAMEYFAQSAGIELVHVPYKGSNETVAGILAGDIHSTFNGVSNFVSHLNAGTIRALATAGAKRLPQVPDIPTVQESGVASLRHFDVLSWFGMFAPKGTPQAIVEQVQVDVAAVLKTAAMQKALEQRGFVVVASTGPEFAKIIKDDTERWRQLIKDAHIKPE